MITRKAYYGSSVRFSKWDPTKTSEFGIHFGLDDPSQSIHRIESLGGKGYLFEVEITYDPARLLKMNDIFRWNLENMSRHLKWDLRTEKLKALKLAKETGIRLSTAENIVISEKLSKEYDAIIYDNLGEGGGKAIIVWNPQKIKTIKVENLNEGFSEIEKIRTVKKLKSLVLETINFELKRKKI